MAEVVKSKLKLLYLAKIFRSETDEEHGLSVQQIIEKLAEKGIEVERKTVYRDLDCLRAFGLDITENSSHRPNTYHLVNREFQDEELLLMGDAVQSSRFLTQKKSSSLVRAIGNLGSKYISDSLVKRVHVEGRIKNQNETVFYYIDAIQSAMNAKRKVQFKYYKVNGEGRRVAQHGGKLIAVTPVQLMYMDDQYYLIAWNDEDEKLKTYRVDRMDKVGVSVEQAVTNDAIKEFDVAKYQGRVFEMFSGEVANVTLSVDPSAMGVIVDRFGRGISIAPGENGRSRIHVQVMESPTFYAWLAKLGTQATIEAPKHVRENYVAYLKGIIESY